MPNDFLATVPEEGTQSENQVRDCLARSGDAVAGLRTALDKHPVLRTLAETPLVSSNSMRLRCYR